MSITRINTFRALDEHIEELKAFLQDLLPTIRSSTGCQSCQFLQDQAQPASMLIIEVWESADAHRASLQQVPPERIAQVKTLLAAPPTGSYYQ